MNCFRTQEFFGCTELGKVIEIIEKTKMDNLSIGLSSHRANIDTSNVNGFS